MNLGQRIKQASKSLYLTDSFITLRSLCQELAHLGPIRIKYKLELNHVIRVTVKKHVFGETKFTYLRVTSTCSQYIVAVNSKLGRTKDKESSYLCGSKNNNVEQKVAKNPGGGLLPYLGYIGMCRCEGYGFQAVHSRTGL